MARLLRVDYPGAFYHVMSRGNNQENIFKNNRDREKFLEYLGKANEPFSIFIHTYGLMSNHISSIGGNAGGEFKPGDAVDKCQLCNLFQPQTRPGRASFPR
jgi:hypothetical protein